MMAEGLRPTYARRLDELRRADDASFGAKSASLGELLAAAIPVPGGFALAAEAFHTFVSDAGLQGRLAAAQARLSAGDLDSVSAVSRAISEAMRFAPVPEGVREQIAACYAALAGIAGEAEPPVAVRSSALGEDSQEATFAGQQESYLWVRGLEHVCDAVRDCWVSLYSPPALAYRARLARAPEPAMGVTVQLMVDAEVSGVMFTCSPVSGDPSMVAINASWGLGLAVVGGEVTPDDYLISKVTGEVVREHVHHKHVQYLPDPRGRGTVAVDVAQERRDVPCLEAAALAALVDIARRIERHFGCHQDIEWAIARRSVLPESLFVVQSRPVTAVSRPKAGLSADAMALVMSTFGVRRGAD
jgi:phosphoenolpyruvate synthase/pyruvate phosphate dikinase